MRINHNSMALNASDHFAGINKNIAKSMKRLSSGKKITSPADDAAGLAISTKLNAQIKGLDRAALNANDGISVIRSAEGGLSEMHNILQRMRELAVKAANDVEDELDRDAIQEEIDALAEELTQISDTTAFNGQILLNGNLTRRTLPDNGDFKVTYLSHDVPPGEYEVEVTTAAEQAKTTFSIPAGPITAEQAGSITVNDFQVEITEGMTRTDIYEALQTHLDKIGMTVESNDNGATAVIKTEEYGKKQYIEVKIANTELNSVMGGVGTIDDKGRGVKNEGKDCEATITKSSGNPTDKGFSQTATYTTDGNKVTIVDKNGFEMTVEIASEKKQDPNENGAKTGKTKIEVLTAGTMIIQTGANSGEQVSIDIPDLDAKGLGVDKLVMYTHAYAAEAIEIIDKAVSRVSDVRSKLGAYENRFNDVYDGLKVQSESITEAYSRIMDTDMAEEMTNYTQQDVLSQAAISMMQRSNERPESILQLLQ